MPNENKIKHTNIFSLKKQLKMEHYFHILNEVFTLNLVTFFTIKNLPEFISHIDFQWHILDKD